MVTKAAAENVVPGLLELGGKGPNIIFEDADMEKALTIAALAAFRVTGLSCSSGSRLLIQDSISEEFVSRLRERTKMLKIGRGEEDPDLGPVISQAQYDRVSRYIEIGKKEVAELVIGGSRPGNLPMTAG